MENQNIAEVRAFLLKQIDLAEKMSLEIATDKLGDNEEGRTKEQRINHYILTNMRTARTLLSAAMSELKEMESALSAENAPTNKVMLALGLQGLLMFFYNSAHALDFCQRHHVGEEKVTENAE